MKKNIIILIWALLFFNTAFCTTTVVNNLASLTSTFSNANPGDIIVIANGTYDWDAVTLANTKGSSTSNWITVKAQSKNGVIFTGSTYFQFSGYKISIDGFIFSNGNASTNPVIAFRSSTSSFANYSRVTNLTIDNYNTTSIDTTIENEWIGIWGVHNRVDHCTLINKSNPRATIVVWYSTATFPEKSVSTFHLIDSNYFYGRSYMGGNGGETIRVGVGNNSRTDGYNTIEYNLFENCTQTEPEIVSNKSCHNTYRYNTFKNCNGGLTLRMGKYCDVYGNYFIVDDLTKTDSYGVRIIDKGHKVYNNYFEGLLGSQSSSTTMRTPIVIFNGSFAASDSLNPLILNGEYLPADSAFVAFNTIVNCKGIGLRIGHNDYGSALYQPKGLKIGNNIIKMSTGQAAFNETTNTSLTYTAEGNKYNAPDGLGITPTTGFSSNSLSFGSRANGILSAPSSAQDAAVNTSSYASILGGLDAQKQTRSSTYDIGCDEINGTGLASTHPLDSTEVGANKGSGSPSYQSITFAALPVKSIGDADFIPSASASSGLALTFTSSNLLVAKIVNGNIHIVGPGTTTITAYQNGNAVYDTADPQSQVLTVTTTYAYAVSYTTVLFGSGCNCTVGNLVTNNSMYYNLNSTTTGTRKIDWYGVIKINQSPASVTKFVVNYDGKYSASKTQVIYLYNWSTLSWTQINSKTVGTSDVLTSYTQNSPSYFISADGEIRVRVYTSGGTSNYISYGDWMQVVVYSSSTSKLASNSSTSVSNKYIFNTNLITEEGTDKGILLYTLQQSANVNALIVDAEGKVIKNIIENESQKIGDHQINFDTHSLSIGKYRILLEVGNFKQTINFNKR